MLLKKLEIYGFKSFADRISMRFDKGITAVVGPNGCGKSNIADAVRWVLGEQSAKSLRGSKMEDVIFSGTQVRKSLGFAEVSLTLDNSDGELPVEFSEVTVTRRMFRSGESEYFINRSACRLKDIVELFMDTGVGKEGYSIIGQGRIDEILSTRSEDRRNIFEEAAGIVKYKARRDEAEKKLEKTRNNLMRAEDILTELEQQLQPLAEQSKTAKKYLKLKEKLKFYEINQFLYQYTRHKQRIAELEAQIIQLNEEYCFRKMRLTEMESEKEVLSQSLSTLQQEVDTAKKERYNLLNTSEKLKGEQNLNLERIRQHERENIRLTEEIQRKQQDLDNAKAQLDALSGIINGKREAFEELRSKAEALTDRLNGLNQAIADYQKHIDETKGGIIQVLNRISDCKNQLTRYYTIESSLKSRLEKIEEQFENKNKEQGVLLQERTSLHNKIMSTKKNLEDHRARITLLENTVRAGKEALHTQEERLNREKRLLEGKNSRLKLLEDMKKGYEGFNKTVKEILTACRSNPEISHKVCGIVASLIQVPREFETAIETVLGASLQYIVTEDEEDAKYLINFLKENNYGRTTFLPVSSIRGRKLNPKERKVLNEKGCLGIASELVTCEAKYQGILNQLLGRVVIAEDLDAAILMARRFSYSFRIVTLKGDIVNPGGSMTGGSNAIKGISILGRNREILDLRREISARNSILAEMETRYQEQITYYRNNKASLENTLEALRKLEMQLSTEEESLNRVSMQQADVEKEMSALENENRQIHHNLEELKVSISETNRELRELEDRNADINQETKEFEAYLKEKLEEREACSKEQTDIRIQLAAMQQEIRSLKERTGRMQEDAVRHFKGIETREKQLLNKNEEVKSIQKDMERQKGEIARIEEKTIQLTSEIEKIEKKRMQEGQKLHELEQEIKEWNRIIEEITDKKHRLEVQNSRYEVELENYQNNIWEDYEVTWNTAISYRDENLTLTEVNQQIQMLKKEIGELGDVNVGAIDEYKRVSERYKFMTDQKNDLITAGNNLRNVIGEITTTMKKQFQEEFNVINDYFGISFKKLFDGGQAQLVLENPDDVLNCGIEIIAQPPGKKLQNLSLLSGGERAMTAIAILFAILRHKPTPFCVLDEIDAALDDSNVYQFGRYIKEFSNDTQFVIITHRKGTMEVSDVLYGIAMEEKGVSRIISVKFDEMVS